MIAQYLRIGNYVQDNNGFIFNVVSIHDDGTVYCDFKENEGDVWEFDNNNPCQGIELTEEILLKCGFVSKNIYDNFKLDGIEIQSTVRRVDTLERSSFFLYLGEENESINNRIDSLHQLQNLFFYLTNNELEINL